MTDDSVRPGADKDPSAGNDGANGDQPEESPTERRFAAEAKSWAEAEERLRKASGWVITAFAAIAGLLLAGIHLTALANIAGSVRALALVAVGLTVLGALVVIVANVSVLVASPGNLRTAAENADRASPTHLLTGHTAKALADAYSEGMGPTVAGQLGVDQTKVSSLSLFLDYFDSRFPPTNPQLEKFERDTLNLAMARVKDYLGLAAATYRFKIAMRWLLAGAVMSAVGIVWFADLTSEKDAAEAAQAPTAEVSETRPVLISPLASGAESIESALGEGCADGPIEAFMLSTTEKTAEVVTLPVAGCPSLRLTLPLEDVAIADACPVPAPAPGTTGSTTSSSVATTTTTTVLAAPESEVQWVAAPC